MIPHSSLLMNTGSSVSPELGDFFRKEKLKEDSLPSTLWREVNIVGVSAVDVDFHAVRQPIVGHAKRIRIPHIVFARERNGMECTLQQKKMETLPMIQNFEIVCKNANLMAVF